MYRLQNRLSKCCVVATLLVVAMSTTSADIPRTESGHPVLSGTFDGATLTPLVRPEEFGDERYLTPAKAKALSEAEQRLKEATLANSDPDRDAPPAGGDGSSDAFADPVAGYPSAILKGPMFQEMQRRRKQDD